MSYRSKLRRTAIGICATAVIASSGLLALPAQAAGTKAPATAPSRREAPAEREVASFFQNYYDAVLEQQSEGKNTFDIRKEYLDPKLDEALTTWGSEHHADPVLRRSEVVKNWELSYKGDADGQSTLILTEHWQDGAPDTKVLYTVRLSDRVIVGLTDAPA
ncbi:hypothetical protein [Kitasatospora mediocidica]|uniref:hypothetical protein n=1 Tax=Kitasatospora mediocidica TaxID=58352 RepID=UPI00056BC638|nr:hypothetical protein [Kitasatospora mediocidica]